MDRRRNLSPEVRQARAASRAETRTVRAYLEGLESQRQSRRFRKPPQQTLMEVQAKLETESDQIQKLNLIQKRLDTERLISEAAAAPDMDTLEAAFVEVAKSYGARKGISYKAWRELGVPAAALTRSGIPRTRS